MRLLLIVAIACSALWAALPADAVISVSPSAGTSTTTAGAATFDTFDAPTNTGVATINPRTVCPGGSNCGASSNPAGSAYLNMNDSSATITFTGLVNYFGLYWGTPDAGNTLDFFKGATNVGHFTGSAATSGQSFYNFSAGGSADFFNSIVLSYGSCCFEVDNVAAPRQVSGVPEFSTLALLAAGLAASVSCARNRAMR